MTRQVQRRLFMPENQYYEPLKQCETISIEAANVVVSLASISKQSSKYHETIAQHQQLQLELGLAERFQKIVDSTLNDVLVRLEDGAIFSDYYSDSDLGDDGLWHIKISEAEHIAKQIAPLSNAKDLGVFTEHPGFMKGLRYYAMSLQSKSTPDGPFLHAFRFFSEGFELNRKRWAVIRSVRGPGYYDEVREPGFLFDYEIDCFCYGNDMFILNKDKFRRIFRFYDRVQEDAQRVIYSMQKRVPISNLDEFIAACSRDSRMAVKLADLEEQSYAQLLTMSRVKQNIKRIGLQIEVVEREGREMLVYSTTHKWDFLHLLSDDFLDSSMTGFSYKVSEKATVKSAPRKSQRETTITPRKRNNIRHGSNGKRATIEDADADANVRLADVDA